MNIINQFSYPLIAFGVFFASYIALTRYFKVRWYVTTLAQLGILIAFIGGFILLRPGDNSVDSVDEAIEMVGNGRPTFIEFYSNYCSGCLAFNPQVNAIERDIQDTFNVLRVNIHTKLGRDVRREFGFSFTPEFVLYDPDGEEVWRDHIPPTSSQINSARGNDTSTATQ